MNTSSAINAMGICLLRQALRFASGAIDIRTMRFQCTRGTVRGNGHKRKSECRTGISRQLSHHCNGGIMRVSILGLGEAGRVFSSAFATAGWNVSAFDPADTPTPENVARFDSVGPAVADADLILSLTTARFAAGAAADAGPHLKDDAVFIDLNAASPERKRKVAAALGNKTQLVDGAVLGSVMKFGPNVTVLLAGPQAQWGASLLSQIGAESIAIGEEIGSASQRKLVRSVFVKSLAALIAESMDAARAFDGEQWMKKQIAEWLTDGDSTIDRLDHTTRLHAGRRSHELEDSLGVLAELGVTSTVTEGALATHLRYARSNTADIATALAEVPTPALGDANERRGLMHSAIKPTWTSPRIAGRAFTIETRAGDNKAIHDAIADIRPGDIVVIDGRGETERALIGELIAERLRDAGAVGVVLDAAVRDANGIAELGFPAFARSVTPAGPYRHGPGRSQIPISIGGVVCQPEDYIVADEDGVMVVPKLEAESILQRGRAKLEAETKQSEDHRKLIQQGIDHMSTR
ncbi:NAD(P)-binding domain-containing protein [Brevibacterium sp. FAM 25378]|uniref:RraA family protein n=2 Tax=Brevibacterium TaxID=1696 RepID=UPI001F0F2359|nr:NAD(P)-binding domain-containing protein [Brevibacterium sp. S22]